MDWLTILTDQIDWPYRVTIYRMTRLTEHTPLLDWLTGITRFVNTNSAGGFSSGTPVFSHTKTTRTQSSVPTSVSDTNERERYQRAWAGYQRAWLIVCYMYLFRNRCNINKVCFHYPHVPSVTGRPPTRHIHYHLYKC